MTKQLKRIDKLERRPARGQVKDIKAALEEYLAWVEREVENLEKIPGDSTAANSEVDPTELSRRNVDKLMRVKPKKFRKNTQGQDEPEEEDDEVDLINASGGNSMYLFSC